MNVIRRAILSTSSSAMSHPHFPWRRFLAQHTDAVVQNREARFSALITESDTAGEVLAGQDGGVSAISRVNGERRVLARGISISHSPRRNQFNPVAVRTWPK